MDTQTNITMSADPIEKFKAMQKQSWVHFAPLATFTTPPAARLVRFAGVKEGQRVLDVACGTGVVALTAARVGARVTGADLTPELLAQARENSKITGLEVDWHEADVEKLPFENQRFDVVLSQYGHMFAPRPDVAIGEMLRVLKPGGTIAFSTWPPDHYIGRMFVLVARYLPPPPPGVSPPVQWGDPNIVRERLGSAVKDLTFDRDVLMAPTLSPQHNRWVTEQTAGPVIKLVETLSGTDPAKLREFRQEYDALAAIYFEDNTVRQSYLMSRAIKL
ncbi:MAG TPA: class I SAM-dependent methyltransferase [Candidatus Sulfotelmatobacter sp.]|nr:class I SAM-dependent methyltransferase [Candidatus Sulfotelmatobacter sp.]